MKITPTTERFVKCSQRRRKKCILSTYYFVFDIMYLIVTRYHLSFNNHCVQQLACKIPENLLIASDSHELVYSLLLAHHWLDPGASLLWIKFPSVNFLYASISVLLSSSLLWAFSPHFALFLEHGAPVLNTLRVWSGRPSVGETSICALPLAPGERYCSASQQLEPNGQLWPLIGCKWKWHVSLLDQII